MSSSILITSFLTWKSHHTTNASDDLLHLLLEKELDSFHHLRSIPVDFELAPQQVLARFNEFQPRVLICCGMAEERTKLHIESHCYLNDSKGEFVDTLLFLDLLSPMRAVEFQGSTIAGDVGYFDEDGYLWFRGRRKQLILHDGSNISPQEVEEVFYHNPAVFEVGVFGMPDKYEGETVHAFVAFKPDAKSVSEQELLDFVREHLADYKMPEDITFIEALPKGATGKIDRKLLMKYYSKA